MSSNLHQLYANRLNNIESHKCAITPHDYERIKPKIEMIERLAEIEGSIYSVFDLHKKQYLLQSREQKEIFGYSDASDPTISFEMHYKQIHPKDLPFVLETDNMLYKFFKEMSYEEKKNYKLVYDFRTRNTNGIYVRHIHQSIPIEADKNDKTWLTLVISHPVLNREDNCKPQRRLINLKTQELHLFNTMDGNNSDLVLTKREKEILILISRGYDSFNIAGQLNISINTVNNHRQNILRKTNTENATQAVLYCKQIGII